MKKIITLATILVLTTSGLFIGGMLKYRLALTAIQKTELTDAAIEDTLYQYGFNLSWNDTPTVTDYIISNFK